jgi:hypothetical protein
VEAFIHLRDAPAAGAPLRRCCPLPRELGPYGGTVCFSDPRHPCTHLLLSDKAAALERRRIESHSGGASSLVCVPVYVYGG